MGYFHSRSAPASPTHGVSMNPSLKQQTQQSRTESLSEDEQKVFQQPNTINSQMVHKAEGALLVTDPSEISAKSSSLEYNTTSLPSLQSLKPSVTSSCKGVSPIIAGQPGAHSVFFTSAKLVPQPIYGGHIAKTTSPTTTGQTTFMVPQNTLKPLDKKAIRPNGGASIQPTPTILFRSGGTTQSITALTNQQIGHNIKTVTPLIQANGQVISTNANLLFTQNLVKTNPSKTLEQKLTTTPITNFVDTNVEVTSVPTTLQTVSVIKQPSQEKVKESKPFTSITDILSSKDMKHIQNGDRG